jgi:hypothetical protein
VIFGPDIVEEAETIVHRVQENLKAVKSRQETYANKRRQPLAFEVGDHVYLRVPPMKGVKRFGVKGKLASRYIGPFPILDKCGTVRYKVDLSTSLTGVHVIFHVSQLKKCLKAPVNVVLPELTPLEADLSYPEHPIKILDQKDRVTRRKIIKFFKIQWSNHSEEEATWKVRIFFVLAIRTLSYRREGTCDCSLSLLNLFSFQTSGRDFVLGGRVVTPRVSNPHD